MIDLDAPIAELWDGPGKPVVTPIATLVRHSLARSGYMTVRDLISADDDRLLDIRTFGVGCLAEVHRVLAAHGLAMSADVPTIPDWRDVAQQLAMQLSPHAFCDTHPLSAPDAECTHCADRATYHLYLAKGGRDYRGEHAESLRRHR